MRRLAAVAVLLGCSGSTGAAATASSAAGSGQREPAAAASGEELLAMGLAKRAQGAGEDARVLFESARVALEHELGTRAVLEPRRGVWAVGALAWSADGSRLAVADGGLLHVLETHEFREVLRFRVEVGPIAALAFSPDRRLLAASAGDADGRVGLWDLASARRVAELGTGSGAVDTLVFSPDGSQLAGRRWEGSSVPLWRLPAYELWRRLELVASAEEGPGLRLGAGGRSPRPTMLAFAPDGASLFGVCDERVLGWETGSSTASSTAVASHVVDAKELGLVGEQFHAVAIHPAGQRAAASTESGLLVSWEVASNARLGLVQAHPFGAELAFSRDGERLLSVATDGVVRTFDGASLAPLRVQPKAFDADAVAARPDARAAAFASSGGVVVRDADSGALTLAIRPALPISAVALAPSMGQLALGTEAGAVLLLDTKSGALRGLRGHAAMVTGLAFSPDGRALASSSRDKTSRLWELASGESRRALAHPTALEAVAYRPDGRVLATAGDDGIVRIWDAASGERLRALRGSSCGVLALAFSPDGAVLAANGADHSLSLWDAATFAPRVGVQRTGSCGGELASWRGTLGFDADGALIASAPSGHEVGLWSARTGQPQGALPDLSPDGREFHVRSVAVSPREPLVVAAAGERLVSWRLSDRSGAAVAAGPVEVDAVTFSSDGRFVIGASRRGAVSLWRVSGAAELELALWLELDSEASGSVRTIDGRVQWLGAMPPAACVLAEHVYPPELCEADAIGSGLWAEAVATRLSAPAAPR